MPLDGLMPPYPPDGADRLSAYPTEGILAAYPGRCSPAHTSPAYPNLGR